MSTNANDSDRTFIRAGALVILGAIVAVVTCQMHDDVKDESVIKACIEAGNGPRSCRKLGAG